MLIGTSAKRVLIAAALIPALLAAAVSAATASTATVVLGSSAFAAPDGAGWGKPHPSEIFNGGDPSGLVTHIQWSSWGGATASGHGLNAIFKPNGGYYGKLVTIELHAYDKGRCTAHGPIAYRRLSVREPARPGGPLGPWESWGGSTTVCRGG
jgi:hypothetical protein